MTVLYSNRRKEIKTGDLIAYKTNEIDSFFGLVLYLYQKILGAKFTHVGVALVLEGKVFLVEAVPPRSHMVPIEVKGNFYHIPVALVADKKKVVKFLDGYLGKVYSLFDMFKQQFGFARNKDDYYCSELADDFYLAFGYLKEPAGHSPDTLVKAILELNGNKIDKVVIDRGNLS